jgi:diguanylate cyclase (GGDEF)-like protein
VARIRPSATTERVVVAASLAVAGLVALVLALSTRPAGPEHTRLTWWMLALLVVACELVYLTVQVRREAHAISLVELATVVGLFFASGTDFVLGRLVGGLAVFVLWRRQSLVKIAFNTGLYAAETVVALGLFHLLRGGGDAVDPRSWLAALAATAVMSVIASVAVTAAIALTDGGVRWADLGTEVVRGVTTSAWVTAVALVAVHALDDDPVAAVPLAVSLGSLLLGWRAYSALSERHLSLERLYRFSHAVSSTPEVDEILEGVLQHAREVMRGGYAEVIFVSSEAGHQPLRIDSVGDAGALHRIRLSEEEAAEPIWRSVMAGGVPRLVPRGDRSARAFLDHRGIADAVIAPLRGDAGIVGTILVGDRLGELMHFDADDVQLLETVANHASMALQHGRLVDRLRHDALHDSLTGLPNRSLLQREVVQALSDTRAGRSRGMTLMIMDLHGFKQVNDTFGHQLGDLLLQEVGVRISSALGGQGMLARLGGDEFAAVLPGVADTIRATEVAANIQAALERPIGIDGVDVEVGISIGVAVAPEHGTDGHTLMKRADAAMYDAKQNGTGVNLYEAGLDADDSPEQLALVHELRQGIATGQIEVYVQPQMSLETGRVTGAEALARWRHPRHGMIFPDVFIPLAERTGLIRQLTIEVLEQSVAACGRWRRAGLRLGMAVNVSARASFNTELVETVQRLLVRHGVPPEALTLEITESSVIRDPVRTGEVLARLHHLGVRLSIDDFGTGYSSLSYLRQLPVQEVKVDKSFVMTMRDEPDDAAIVRSIVDLGGNLGLDVVAEGVEDEPTLDELRRMGCTLMQGFFLSPPMPLPGFEIWLAALEGRTAKAHHLP